MWTATGIDLEKEQALTKVLKVLKKEIKGVSDHFDLYEKGLVSDAVLLKSFVPHVAFNLTGLATRWAVFGLGLFGSLPSRHPFFNKTLLNITRGATQQPARSSSGSS